MGGKEELGEESGAGLVHEVCCLSQFAREIVDGL